MLRCKRPLVLALLLSALGGAPAIAQQPAAPATPATPAGPAKERQERREERREERQEQRQERKDERNERREERQEHREERQERREERQERREERRDDRQERRQARREELRKRWGDLVQRPEARAELRVHARRMARLHRIRALAQQAGKTEVVERADKLIAKERERHQRAMDHIRTKQGGKP
jgi:TolA-binding protein